MATLARIAALVMTLLLASACAAPRAHYPYAQEPDPRQAEYVIGVADGLSIRVWKNSDLSTEATVRPDGRITLPLAGELVAAGKTPSQLREAITRALSVYLRQEALVVTVAVNKVASYRIIVLGNVERPGVIDADRYLTVSEAIALAGGPNRFASANDTVVLRTGPDGRLRRIPIAYEEIQAGRHLEQDLVLLRGDRIYVP